VNADCQIAGIFSCNSPIPGPASRLHVCHLQSRFLTSFFGFTNMQEYELKQRSTVSAVIILFFSSYGCDPQGIVSVTKFGFVLRLLGCFVFMFSFCFI